MKTKKTTSIKHILKIALLMLNVGLCAQHSSDLYRVVGIPIPKCGSNMLLKMLRKMCHAKLTIPRRRFFLIDDNAIKMIMENPIWLLMAHAIYVDDNIKKINNERIRKIFIYRDPRDQIVSAAFWIQTIDRMPQHEWSLDDLIYELIIGGGELWAEVFLAKEPWSYLHGIQSFYDLYLPWMLEPNVYTTTFEKLVGKQGGGSEDEQIKEIIAIANHVGKPLTQEQAKKIADELFGGTLTFRAGQIGSWRGHFTERHKIAFKAVAGQLLIDLGYEEDFNW